MTSTLHFFFNTWFCILICFSVKISTLKKLLLLHSHCARWWDMLGDAYLGSSMNRDILKNVSNPSKPDQIHLFGSPHFDHFNKSSDRRDCFHNHTQHPELKVEETKLSTKSEGIHVSCRTEEVKPLGRTEEGIKPSYKTRNNADMQDRRYKIIG